jgi:hypothetical protein
MILFWIHCVLGLIAFFVRNRNKGVMQGAQQGELAMHLIHRSSQRPPVGRAGEQQRQQRQPSDGG